MFAYYLDQHAQPETQPRPHRADGAGDRLGAAASMTSWSVFRAVSGDPIPWKSSQLFVPQVDNWGPNGRRADGDPPNAMDYTDATALMRDHRAKTAVGDVPDQVLKR